MKGMLDFAAGISREAGALLLDGFRNSRTIVSYKSRTDLVTNMDRASEKLIFDSIRKKFPDHTVIAEEGSRSDADGDFVWYVDPLDGTNNYAHGLPFFCVSIGVFSKSRERIEAGVVYNPFLDELFTALRGGGASLNGRRIGVSAIGDIGISMLATGFPYDRTGPLRKNLGHFNDFMPLIQGIRRLGAAAIDLCYVACGRLDGFWEGNLKPWDTAAGTLMVEEAGGRVSRYDGSRYDPEYPEVLASNGNIHDAMIGVLSRPSVNGGE